MPRSVGAIPIAHPDYGATYAAVPAAATAQVIKSTAGVLKHLSIAGTGTAGTVALIDGLTTIMTYGVPAAVTGFAVPLPAEGLAFPTSIKVTTTGTGVTALVGFV